MKLTEGMIQAMIWIQLNRRLPLFCNVFTGSNEWDSLHISAAGYATGYEIKLSKSDLRADFKKPRHTLLSERKERADRKYGPSIGILIKHFYYVCGGFDVGAEDVPEYAGLMISNQYGLKIIKNAPTLWKEKVSEKTISNLYEVLGKRYMYKELEKHQKAYRKSRDEELL